MTMRVFVTGGASGLGRALASQLVKVGAQVLIGDLDGAAAEKTAAEIGAAAIGCDVRTLADLEKASLWVKENWGGLDLLVNNAGVAQMGAVDKTSIEDWQWIIDINVLGVVRGTQAFLPLMPAGARILNIASMAALVHLPGSSAYSASKAAVLAISETLMLELEGRGIRVHVACPAFFRTNLARNMRAADDASARVTTRLVERARSGPEEIAGIILDRLQRGDAHIFTHPAARRSWLFKRYLPFQLFQNLLRRQLAQLDERMARSKRGTP
jgi:NAD(P)-dependent dehydrogenase (short-subunit alcohol dehydrogenase family)